MFRILLAASFVAVVSPLLAEETDQAVLNQEALDEIREIRGSLTLGEAMEGDAEAFSKALITVVSDAAADETNKQEEANKEPEVCPNGGSCCENVSSKVIAKAMMARFGQQANDRVTDEAAPVLTVDFPTPPPTSGPENIREVHPGRMVPSRRTNWNSNPTAWQSNQRLADQLRPAPSGPNNSVNGYFIPHPHHPGPHHNENHHIIHTLRETAHELDRIAHRLEMANLCDAADEIRDAACELREEARDLLDENHDEDVECDEDECEDDHDHEGHHHDESHDHDHDD